jgi:hypothetical protein
MNLDSNNFRIDWFTKIKKGMMIEKKRKINNILARNTEVKKNLKKLFYTNLK